MLTQQLLQLAVVGGEWVLWGLVAVSVISIGVIVERWWYFSRRRCDVAELGQSLLARLRANDRAGALKLLSEHPSEEAVIVSRCLGWLDSGPEAVADVLAATVRERRKTIVQGTLFLGTVGNNAPFIGLFGTVLGVVEAFDQLGHNAMGSVSAVMTGIGEALVATAAGILVAIPAVIAYNVFSKKADDVEENAQALVSLVQASQRSAGK